MPAIPIIALAVTAASAVSTADAQRKQAHAAQDAANAAKTTGPGGAQVDINALNDQTKAIATQNAIDSANLEKSLTPEVPALRSAANNAVLGGIGGNPTQAALTAQLASRFGQPATSAKFNPVALQGTPNLAAPHINSPLMQAAIAKAQADLGLGGQLSLDQRNEAARQGAAQAGTTGGGTNLGLGRDLVARDLGLTSYNVEQQRLQNASQLGGQDIAAQQAQQNALLQASQFNQNNQLSSAQFNSNQNLQGAQFGLSSDALNAQNYLNQYGLLNSYYNNLQQQNLAAASFGQSIPMPQVGLNPGSVANIAVANQNVAAQGAANSANIQAQGAQNQTQFGGQLLGYGLQTFGNYLNSPSSNTGAGTNPLVSQVFAPASNVYQAPSSTGSMFG